MCRAGAYSSVLTLRIWKILVELLLQRNFTFITDLPMAFNGLANELERQYSVRVCAGQIVEESHVGLLWAPSENATRSSVRVPSWSWQSINGPIDMSLAGLGMYGPKIEVVDAFGVTEDGLPHTVLRLRGRVTRALMKIDGPSLVRRRDVYYEAENEQELRPLGIKTRCDFPNELVRDADYIIGGEKCGFMEVFLLTCGYGLVHDSDTPQGCGLILQRRGNGVRFSRRGTFEPFSLRELVEAFDVFQQCSLGKEWKAQKRGTHGLVKAFEIELV